MNGAGVSRCDRSPIIYSIARRRGCGRLSSSSCGRSRKRSSSPSWSRISIVEGWTVSPRKSRKKSACFSSTRHRHAGAGEQQAGHDPGRPAADDQQRRSCRAITTPSWAAKRQVCGGDRRGCGVLERRAMAGEIQITPALSDALTILGAAGIVIPAFARFRINPVIGFILVGIIAGPFGLGALTGHYPWLDMGLHHRPGGHRAVRRARHRPAAVLDRARAQLPPPGGDAEDGVRHRRGRDAADRALLIGGGADRCSAGRSSRALWLALALAMSSTALVLPISGHPEPGRPRRACDAAVRGSGAGADAVPDRRRGGTAASGLGRSRDRGRAGDPRHPGGRPLRPAAAVRPGGADRRSPNCSSPSRLLVVILASTVTASVGLSPILGALVAGLLIAETEYRSEVEVVIEPFKGLALGVFLITVGMRIDCRRTARRLAACCLARWRGVCWSRRWSPALLLRMAGARPAVAARNRAADGQPVGNHADRARRGRRRRASSSAETVGFLVGGTAIGLTITPLLASLGRFIARRVDHAAAGRSRRRRRRRAGKTVIFGFGRVGRMVADMLERTWPALSRGRQRHRRLRRGAKGRLFRALRRCLKTAN